MERISDVKRQEKLAKAFKAVISAGLVAPVFVSVSSCKEAPAAVEEEQQIEEKPAVESAPATTVTESVPSTTETIPETTIEIEKVDAPEIKGEAFNFVFNQESKKYIDEETKEEVGVWVEDAVKIEGKMTSAIALKAEAINKILEENKEKGIFKCPWPFDWQKDKDMEIVELFWTSSYQQEIYEKYEIYLSSFIAIKFTKPINFYSPFDVDNESPGNVSDVFPDKKEDPNFTSAQEYKNLMLTSAFNYKSEGAEGKSHASIQFNFIDWRSLVALGKSYELGNEGYCQDIIGEIKTGTVLGEILPNKPDFDFLDFSNNPEFQKNPGQFQGNLIVSDFQDDFSKPTSSLEKMLKYKNKAGQEIPVCVWPEENTAYEQNN
jgi:hypothetical protein